MSPLHDSIPKEGQQAVKDLLAKFDLPTTEPVKVHSEAMIESVFGEHFRNDFPKWCEENGLRCFYLPATRFYLFFPSNYIDKVLEE